MMQDIKMLINPGKTCPSGHSYKYCAGSAHAPTRNDKLVFLEHYSTEFIITQIIWNINRDLCPNNRRIHLLIVFTTTGSIISGGALHGFNVALCLLDPKVDLSKSSVVFADAFLQSNGLGGNQDRGNNGLGGHHYHWFGGHQDAGNHGVTQPADRL